MKYASLGKTGLKVSKIGIGCMSYGSADKKSYPWILDENESRKHIKNALNQGINFFDTSNMYSQGSSEEILGRAIQDFIARDKVVIATKVFFPLENHANSGGLSRKAIMNQIDASLKRLGTDHVDLYQIHRWDYTTPIEETMEALHDVVKAGKARYIGASSMYAWQFCKALYVAELNGWTRFVSMQNHYNLIYREEEREMLQLCEDQDVGVLPWSPLARGRLSRPWKDSSSKTLRSETDHFSQHLYNKSEDLDRLVVEQVGIVAKQRGISQTQVALAWLLNKKVVSAPLIGTTKDEHLVEAIQSLDIILTDEEIRMLEQHYIPHEVIGLSAYDPNNQR